jgi:hypothetical protein
MKDPCNDGARLSVTSPTPPGQAVRQNDNAL